MRPYSFYQPNGPVLLLTRFRSTPGYVVLFAALVLLIATPLTGGITAWNTESGAVEWLSFGLLLLCPIAFLIHQPIGRWLPLIHIPVLTLLLAKREAEQDWWIVDERLFGAEFYVDQGVSFTALAGVLIVALVLFSLATLVVVGAPAAWKGLRGHIRWLILLGVGVFLAVVGQGLEEVADSSGASGTKLWVLQTVEESTEAVFALLLILSILAAPTHKPQ